MTVTVRRCLCLCQHFLSLHNWTFVYSMLWSPLTYDLNGLKSKSHTHLVFFGSFYLTFLYGFHGFLLLSCNFFNSGWLSLMWSKSHLNKELPDCWKSLQKSIKTNFWKGSYTAWRVDFVNVIRTLQRMHSDKGEWISRKN